MNFNTAVILDAFGSMMADLNGVTRLKVAQDAVGDLGATLPSSINASLWVYGHRVEQDDQAASCLDIEEVIPMGQVDAAQFEQMARSFPAKGYTPIANSLMQAAATLPVGESEANTLILVSDGGDPCALAAQFAASDAQVVVHAIGLAVDDVTRANCNVLPKRVGERIRMRKMLTRSIWRWKKPQQPPMIPSNWWNSSLGIPVTTTT